MTSSVKITELPKDVDEQLRAMYRGHSEGFLQFGDGKYIMPSSYRGHADAMRAMPVRRDDVWVVTYPRCGTTWVQELVWMVNNDYDYKKASAVFLTDRYVFIDLFPFASEQKVEIEAAGMGAMLTPGYVAAEQMASPRFIKSHLPLSLLPPRLLDDCKVVYVARDPRDAAVSFFYHNQSFTVHDYVGDFKTYWDLFHKDYIPWTPFWTHVKEAWAQRRHPNMLFLFYEEMKKDLPGTVKRVADFFGKSCSDEQLRALCDHLEFKNFKQNPSVNYDFMKDSPFFNKSAQDFIRQGKVGGWSEHFDEAMRRQAQEWMEENLRDTDLRFPSA